MTLKQYLGLLGFLFVAAWAGFDFGVALLCLLGAGAFAGILRRRSKLVPAPTRFIGS